METCRPGGERQWQPPCLQRCRHGNKARARAREARGAPALQAPRTTRWPSTARWGQPPCGALNAHATGFYLSGARAFPESGTLKPLVEEQIAAKLPLPTATRARVSGEFPAGRRTRGPPPLQTRRDQEDTRLWERTSLFNVKM